LSTALPACGDHTLFCNSHGPSPISPLSLHDALPIFHACRPWSARHGQTGAGRVVEVAVDVHDFAAFALEQARAHSGAVARSAVRSEEHTSELQSRFDLVCRLLLEKKKPHIYSR